MSDKICRDSLLCGAANQNWQIVTLAWKPNICGSWIMIIARKNSFLVSIRLQYQHLLNSFFTGIIIYSHIYTGRAFFYMCLMPEIIRIFLKENRLYMFLFYKSIYHRLLLRFAKVAQNQWKHLMVIKDKFIWSYVNALVPYVKNYAYYLCFYKKSIIYVSNIRKMYLNSFIHLHLLP